MWKSTFTLTWYLCMERRLIAHIIHVIIINIIHIIIPTIIIRLMHTRLACRAISNITYRMVSLVRWPLLTGSLPAISTNGARRSTPIGGQDENWKAWTMIHLSCSHRSDSQIRTTLESKSSGAESFEWKPDLAWWIYYFTETILNYVVKIWQSGDFLKTSSSYFPLPI